MASPSLILFHVLKLRKGFKITHVNYKYYKNHKIGHLGGLMG